MPTFLEHLTVPPDTLCPKQFLAFTGNIPVDKVDPRIIDAFKVERRRTASPSTVNISLRTVKTFFNTLQRWGLISINPAKEVKQIRIPLDLPPHFSEAEFQLFVDRMADRWLQEIVIFAGMTGLRLGEILNARWEDVDLGQGTLLVRSSEGYTMKAGRMRKIPLNDTCVSLLMNKDSKQGFIFRGRRRGKANTNYVSAQFRKAVRLQGMDQKLHFHSLRHTFSTMLIKKGASLYQIQKLLGHSSPRVTETYAHLQPDELHHVVSRVSICHDANDAPLNQEQ